MPQSVIKYSLIFATLAYLLSGCGGGGSGGGSGGSSSDISGKGAGNATVSWTPPTENTDGSVLGADLAGYRIYYGTSSRDYSNSLEIDNPGLSSFVVEGLDEAIWCFVMTAVNTSGIESSYSEEACLSVTTS
jgi:hypothetical protein